MVVSVKVPKQNFEKYSRNNKRNRMEMQVSTCITYHSSMYNDSQYTQYTQQSGQHSVSARQTVIYLGKH